MKTAEKPTVDVRPKEVIISRSFDAPRNLVYRVWTEPEYVKNWWGPRAMTTPISESDLREGGKYRVVMRDQQGVDYDMHGAYKEIIPNERLVFTTDLAGHPQAWKDMLSKNIGRAVLPKELQPEMTVIFRERDGKTHLSV